ncbi:MAG: PDZ domain-containing protein [Holophagales bacterium]|nr:PDZ domain-containing protein [Holophagales bacterium]
MGLLGAGLPAAQAGTASLRILAGENWNPKLKAPLTQPGVDVKEGDFLLAVNGRGPERATTTSTASSSEPPGSRLS